MANPANVERTIKHKVFTYYVELENTTKPDGTVGDVTVERLARRGETVKLREADANRGDSLGAFYTDDELDALARGSATAGVTPPPPPSLDLVTSDEDETRKWLQGEGPGPKPSVPQVISLVNSVEEDDRDDVIKRVLAAEKDKTGSDPRSTLVEALEEALEDEE